MTITLLRVGLMLSAFVAIVYLLRIVAAVFLPIEWFWGGALACLLGPPAFATALRLSTEYPVSLKERV